MFTREIRVRYSECDAQGVLFNSHYLAFCDHAMDDFLLESLGVAYPLELMLKSATLNWSAPASYRDVVNVDLRITRWGNTSFDVGFQLSVAGQSCCDVSITYVCVTLDADGPTPTSMPSDVRAAFESATA